MKKHLSRPCLVLAYLGLALGPCMFVTGPYAQAYSPASIRAPGDLTLHGDPDCAYWLPLDAKVKEVWIKAILNPLNMTYLQRKRPRIDRYGELNSLIPAIAYTDGYCSTRPQSKAMSGAINYFEVLTSGTDTLHRSD